MRRRILGQMGRLEEAAACLRPLGDDAAASAALGQVEGLLARGRRSAREGWRVVVLHAACVAALLAVAFVGWEVAVGPRRVAASVGEWRSDGQRDLRAIATELGALRRERAEEDARQAAARAKLEAEVARLGEDLGARAARLGADVGRAVSAASRAQEQQARALERRVEALVWRCGTSTGAGEIGR